jgi:hypothetical protein
MGIWSGSERYVSKSLFVALYQAVHFTIDFYSFPRELFVCPYRLVHGLATVHDCDQRVSVHPYAALYSGAPKNRLALYTLVAPVAPNKPYLTDMVCGAHVMA